MEENTCAICFRAGQSHKVVISRIYTSPPKPQIILLAPVTNEASDVTYKSSRITNTQKMSRLRNITAGVAQKAMRETNALLTNIDRIAIEQAENEGMMVAGGK